MPAAGEASKVLKLFNQFSIKNFQFFRSDTGGHGPYPPPNCATGYWHMPKVKNC